MATETLRPNAAGDSTELYPNPIVANYLNVDEEVSDNDGTYVSTDTNDQLPERDLYNLPASAIGALDTINSVTVHIMIRSTSNSYKGAFMTQLKTNGVVYDGTLESPMTTYTEYTKEYLLNPQTGLAWTLDEINAMQIGEDGYSGKRLYGAIYPAFCTQSWAVIDFTPAVAAVKEFQGDGLIGWS